MKGKNCSVHQRHSMILGKSRKIRTFTVLDTPRFNDVSGYRIFMPRKKFDSGKIRVLILNVYAACPEPDTSPYLRFSQEYGFVSTNIGTMTQLISHSEQAIITFGNEDGFASVQRLNSWHNFYREGNHARDWNTRRTRKQPKRTIVHQLRRGECKTDPGDLSPSLL